METAFTPIASLSGGTLIGAAAVLLMAVHGRIAGATGILTGVLVPKGASDWIWRAAFLAGMVTGPALYLALFGVPIELSVPVSSALLALGGLIVGSGVVLGNGCTSGHGVCGLARLSGRSLAATLTFMVITALTVFILRHVVGV